jgi:hypothetical protein
MAEDEKCEICGQPMTVALDLGFAERDFRDAAALCDFVANRASSLSTPVVVLGMLSLRVARAAKVHNADALSAIVRGAIELVAARAGAAARDCIRADAQRRTGANN